MIPVDGIDLALAPLRYPGPSAAESMLVLPECQHSLTLLAGRPLGAARVTRCEPCAARYGVQKAGLDDELRIRGAASVGQRTPVVAVGSNACPGVVRAKLDRADGDAMIPLVLATVRDLRIGISAHVSRPGFVPAAPARFVGELARVVVGWLDRAQLRRLDETEPNYHRVRVQAVDHPLILDGGQALPGFDLYQSAWGVLAAPHGPIRLPSQPELFELLGGLGLEPWRSLPPRLAVRALAASESLRAELRATFRRSGLVADSGLRTGPPMS
jgi:hypothetical protein